MTQVDYTHRNLARRLWAGGHPLADTAHPDVRAEYARITGLEKQLDDLRDVEALATAFAMLVAVGFDFSKLDEQSWVFLHGACVVLGRGDFFDLREAEKHARAT